MPYPVIPITTLVPQQSVTSQRIAVPNTAQPVQMMFLNDGSCMLNIINAQPATTGYAVSIMAVPDGAGRTGTTTTPTGYSFTVPANSEQYFGPFRQSWWNQTTGDVGYVYLTFGVNAGPAIANLYVEAINF
jgi:hypothetical protein